jgi:hypothetical protein
VRAIPDRDLRRRPRRPACGPGTTFNLRDALAHMIEESARHCGHLDLLGESIDGEAGE